MCSHFHEQCWVQLPANALSQHFGGDEVGGAVSLDLGILPEEGPEHEVGAAVSGLMVVGDPPRHHKGTQRPPQARSHPSNMAPCPILKVLTGNKA